MEVVGFIAHFFILGFLNAGVSNVQAGQLLPSSFGGLAGADVRQLLLRQGILNDVQGCGIELTIHLFMPCQVIGIDGCKSSLYDIPHLHRTALQMRLHQKLPKSKVSSIKFWR